jgi:hypothetical protein
MEQSVRRRENDTKFSPRRRPVMNKEEKVEDHLPALASLTLNDGSLVADSPKATEKNDIGKKPKRTFCDLRPVVQDLLNDCFSKLNFVPSDLDPSIYDSLLDFPDPIQCEIVASFCRADLASIRNKTGYFIGILKQYRKNGKATSSGNSAAYSVTPSFNSLPFQYLNPQSPFLYPPFGNFFPQFNSFSPYNYGLMQARHARATDLGFAEAVAGSFYPAYPQAYGGDMFNVYGQNTFPNASSYLLSPPQANFSPSFSKICPKAQARLAHLYNTFIIRRTDLEDCVFDSLADFPEIDQLRMCDAFAQANLINVRNKTAFFIGILKRHRSHLQSHEILTQQSIS